MREKKSSLKEDELLIHIDFSENYNCKQHSEIQSCHFGASHSQVTLHTGVAYTSDEKAHPFCTVTDYRKHDPHAIMVHLEIALKKFSVKMPSIKHLVFVSDAPATQYRNKQMFYYMATEFFKLKYESVNWNFLEAAHGKGAADGIGGVLKRTADRKVAQGMNIVNAKDFIDAVKDVQVDVIYIDNEEFTVEKATAAQWNGVKIPGTMKIHQASSLSQ